MEKIIMYASDSCNYCKSVKEYLDKENINYKVRLVDEWRDEWEQIIGLTGVGLLPTISYEDNFFLPGRNFSNPERLVFLLKNYKKSKFDDLMVIKQHINTLNYNMSMAFGNMDKLLKQIEDKLNIEENDG